MMADDEKEEVEGAEPEELKKSYPSNSHLKKDLTERKPNDINPRKASKVTTGIVIKKKRSLADSFAESFFGDDTKSVGSYILYDVLIPAAKSALTDMITGGIEMLLYGEPRNDRIRRDKGRSYVSYSSMYGDRDRNRTRERTDVPRNRARQRFDDIIVDRLVDAEEVLAQMADIVENYGVASVADFYDLVGLNGEYSDYKYGWDNLAQAKVVRVREGYTFVLPKPFVLD
ncbi:MAG: hypothetical protein ACHQEM_11695 [Chitinophagales bacterium]